MDWNSIFFERGVFWPTSKKQHHAVILSDAESSATFGRCEPFAPSSPVLVSRRGVGRNHGHAVNIDMDESVKNPFENDLELGGFSTCYMHGFLG